MKYPFFAHSFIHNRLIEKKVVRTLLNIRIQQKTNIR